MNLKTYLIGIFIISSTFKIYSQDKFKTGINSGLTYSNFRGNSYMDDYEPGFDYLLGVSIDYKILEKIYLSTNLNYERKSIKQFYPKSYGGDGLGVIYGTSDGKPPKVEKLKFQTKFQYISIPIMFKYLVGNNNNFFLNGGTYFSYLLDVKNIDDGKDSDLDFNDEFKKYDIGVTFGIGYNYQLNDDNSLSIEIRNNLGILDINKEDYSVFNSTKTNSANLILNWNFRI